MSVAVSTHYVVTIPDGFPNAAAIILGKGFRIDVSFNRSPSRATVIIEYGPASLISDTRYHEIGHNCAIQRKPGGWELTIPVECVCDACGILFQNI